MSSTTSPTTVLKSYEPFIDSRGIIQDLVREEQIDSVTLLVTSLSAVRGNHVHEHTTQWTMVMQGRLLVAVQMPDGSVNHHVLKPFDLWIDAPGTPHAWRALEDDTICIVFTRGPRSGAGYESDTRRLEEPLLK